MIKIENLSKTYVTKKKVETQALKDINLVLEDKGMTFIIGKTGCGKSTLLNIIGKLDEPTSGNIYVDGNCLTTMSSKQADSYRDNYVGFVFQEYNLIDNFTVYENIAMIYKIRGEEVDELTIDKYLEKFELTEQKLKRCDELSGGQRQRVCIIRALVKNPKLILADEPTGALDSKTGKDILNILKNLSKDRLVIVVSHDQAAAKKYADRIITVSDGKIKRDTKKEIIYNNKQNSLPIKTKNFKFGEILKLAFTNLGCRWKRLVIMLLISVISFGALGTVFTYFTYDRNKVVLNSMKEDGINYMYISSSFESSNNFISEEELNTFSNKYNRDVYPIIPDCYLDLYDYRTRNSYKGEVYKYYYDMYAMELNSDIAKNLKLNLICGTYPSADNEIVVSKYFYHYVKAGLYNPYSGNDISVSKPEDIIGTKVYLDARIGKVCTIVGVLDSHFDYSKYEYIDAKKEISDADLTLISTRIGANIETSVDKFCFVNEGFYERNLMINDDLKQNTFNKKLSNYCYYYGIDDSKNMLSDITDFKSYSYGKDDYLYVWKDGLERDVLNKYEIVLNFTDSSVVFDSSDFSYMKYNNVNISNILSEEESLILNENNGANPYGTTAQDREYLKFKVIEKVFNETLFEYFSKISFDIDRSDGVEQYRFNKTFEIVGIAFQDPYKTDLTINDKTYANLSCFINDDLVYELNNGLIVKDYNAFLTPTKSTYSDKKLLSTYNNINSFIKMENYYTRNIDALKRVLQEVAKIMLYLGLGLAVFSGLLFYNYMSIIIDDKKRQTGILRSMGASKRDIMLLYFMECLMLSFIIVILSNIVSWGAGYALNTIMDKTFLFMYHLFSFDFISLFIILGVSLIVSVLASTAPIIKMSKQKPIQMLKD